MKKLKKVLISFLVVCILSVFSFGNLYAAPDVKPWENYFIKKNVDDTKPAGPGNTYYTTSPTFFSLSQSVKEGMFNAFVNDNYYAHVFPYVEKENTTNKWSYIMVSPYEFYLTDYYYGYPSTNVPKTLYFASYGEDKEVHDNDIGFKPKTTSNVFLLQSYDVYDFRNVNFSVSFNLPTSALHLDQLFYTAEDKALYRGGIVKSNFPLKYIPHKGEEIMLNDPRPEVGEGLERVNLKYNKEVFSDFKCSLYPNVEIVNNFALNQNDKFTLSWKSSARHCYVEYEGKDGIVKIQPKVEGSTYSFDFNFTMVGEMTFTFHEGTGEWYDVILDFFSPILDFFFGIFDFFWNLLVDLFTFIFVPEEGFLENYASELMTFIEKKLGFLIYPITLTIDLVSRYLDIPNASGIITIPKITLPIFDMPLYGGTKWNLKETLTYGSLGTMYQIYLAFMDAIVVFGVVALGKRALDNVFAKRGSS